MPAQSLAAHLDLAAPTITSPFHYLAVVYAYLASKVGGLIDTPAERQAIEDTVMAQYDKITLTLLATNPALAGMFAALRPTIKNVLDVILVALAPPPAPTPTPVPVVIPQIPVGSAP